MVGDSMSANPTLSIIIPVFNTESFLLKKCISSLINQRFKDFEILIIDDGSDENFATEYKNISKLDNRIKLLCKNNGGVSSARNLGIKNAVGRYISFVDSDDWVSSDFLELLVNNLELSGADLAVVEADYCYSEEDTTNNIRDSVEPIKVNKSSTYEQMLVSKTFAGFLCNKLFKRELMENLYLDESLHICEDFEFVSRYCKNINATSFIPLKVYHYRQRKPTMKSLTMYNSRGFSLLEARQKIENIYEDEAKEHAFLTHIYTLKAAINLRARYKVSKANNAEEYARIKEIINTYMHLAFRFNQIKIWETINILFAYCFPKVMLRMKAKIRMRGIDVKNSSNNISRRS